MKVGDLVKVVGNNEHRNNQDQVGIIIEDIFNKGKGFRVLFFNGTMQPKLRKSLEVLSESR